MQRNRKAFNIYVQALKHADGGKLVTTCLVRQFRHTLGISTTGTASPHTQITPEGLLQFHNDNPVAFDQF